MTDEKRRSFLDAVDDSDVIEMTPYEAKFLNNNTNRQTFTPKQCNVIDQMMARYGSRLSF